MNNKTILVALSFLINSISIFTSNAQHMTSLIDQLLEARYAPDQPGASILISKAGQIIYEKQVGMANIEYGTPISKNSRFAIGSITKQFTAAAILILEEQGLLNTSDKVDTYVNGFNNNEHPITIEHLLTHTSGIPDYPRVSEVRQKIRNNLSPQNIIDMVQDEPLDFQAGSETNYSNTAYLILGKIIEKVSKKTYSEFLEENIFQKLNMTSTSVSDYQDVIDNRAQGYSEDENDKIINATFHSSSYAAGAIVSTPADLNKWITGLFSGELLNTESLSKMLRNYKLENGDLTNLGYGWEINNINGKLTYEHSGFEPGYKCNSVYEPKEKLYVIILQNNEYGSPTPTMINAAAICLNAAYPNISNSLILNNEQANALTGTYEIESSDTRIIGIMDDHLYIKAPGGQKNELYALNENTLFYKEGYRQLKFSNSKNGNFQEFKYTNRRSSSKAVKIANEIPIEKKAIAVNESILQTYVGDYQSEHLNISITFENGGLFGQPEGSNKVPLIPVSESLFIIEEIGAEVKFSKDSESNVSSINILIEGNKMKAERKEL